MTEPDDPTRPDHGEPGGVSLDELADLQAGLLTPRESAALQARVDADPAAQALLADLDHTTALLTDLDPEPIPDDIAARIDAALRAEIHAATTQAAPPPTSATPDEDEADDPPSGAQVLDLHAARARPRAAATGPRRSRRWQGAALLATAAAVLGAVVVSGVLSEVNSRAPQAGSAPVTLTITAAELEAQWPAIEGVMDFGFLSTPQALEQCLSVAGGDVSSDNSALLGVRPVILDGQYGMLVATPFEDRIVLTVLGPTCGNFTFEETDVLTTVSVPR